MRPERPERLVRQDAACASGRTFFFLMDNVRRTCRTERRTASDGRVGQERTTSDGRVEQRRAALDERRRYGDTETEETEEVDIPNRIQEVA